MKNKIIGFLLILLILVMIPLCAARKTVRSEPPKKSAQPDESVKIIAYAAEKALPEGCCDEALKALIIILNTNYKYNKGLFDKNVGKINNSKTEKYAEMLKGYYITYNKKTVPVPYFRYSAGFTSPGKSHPYIRNSASPWDLPENGKSTDGVSLNGINKLCGLGLDYKSALGWYLKDIEINAPS
ncbi:MAG: hypothetical protein IIU14_06915 [Ruminococcus sp.]|nr:hypothetical protein [Ruminococcus sp.]